MSSIHYGLEFRNTQGMRKQILGGNTKGNGPVSWSTKIWYWKYFTLDDMSWSHTVGGKSLCMNNIHGIVCNLPSPNQPNLIRRWIRQGIILFFLHNAHLYEQHSRIRLFRFNFHTKLCSFTSGFRFCWAFFRLKMPEWELQRKRNSLNYFWYQTCSPEEVACESGKSGEGNDLTRWPTLLTLAWLLAW